MNRKFKTGKFSPFSSNLAFVLNKCDDNDYKISVFLNELPVTLFNTGDLSCSKHLMNTNSKLSGSVCSFKDFKSQLNNYIQAEFDQVCSLSAEFKQELWYVILYV